MALMRDKQPDSFDGEKKVWQCIQDNLPEDIVCYYNREVKGREFDFCLLIKDMGFVIIEVKGWNKSLINKVVSPDEIIMADGSVENSPKKQARSYSFKLKNIMNEKYGINPLVMNMVCYPFISEDDYNTLGLGVVSEPEYTLFSEDIESNYNFSRKILGVYQDFRQLTFDKMVGDKYDVARHHFEPTYIITPPAQDVIPYSCLSVFAEGMTFTDISDIITSYFKGTKQIIFTKGTSDLEVIAKRLSEAFTGKHIMIKKGNLAINPSDAPETIIKIRNNRLSVFNFEAIFISDEIGIRSFRTYNGRLSEEQETVLSDIAAATDFNIDQFRIEHAKTGCDIQVKAGAGTGKTYSMVSRIAFLCSHASNSGIFDPSSEIAMLTFTDDAALNMKSRLKQLFVNYFMLTSNTQYLEMITNIEKMRISTIHSFAKEIISNTAIALGIGTNFTTVSGKYDKQKIFDSLFTAYLEEENKSDPIFFNGLPIGIEAFRKLMLEVANKLYEKGCDIKSLDMSSWGNAPAEMPYLNKIIDQVVIETEKEYSKFLIDNNAVALSEYMIHLCRCIDNDAFNTNLYEFKYVFIDEFQDTDDAQITSFIAMQKKLGFNFFIVGDFKQSIYRFRGATMTAFEKMGCDNGNWLSFTLSINYRSDKRLLNRFDRTFSCMSSMGLLKYEKNTDALKGIKTNNNSDDHLVVPIPYHRSDKTNSTKYYDMLFKAIEEQKHRIELEMQHNELSPNERTIAILTRSNYQINEILNEAKKREVVIESDNNSDLYRLAPSTDLCRLTSALCNPYNTTFLFDLIHSRNVNVIFDIRSILGKTFEEKTAMFIDCLDKFYSSAMGKTWRELIHDIQNEPVLKTLRLIYDATKPWKAFSPFDEHMQEYYRSNYELVFEELSGMNKKSYLTLDSINESLHINIMTGTGAKSRESNTDTGGITVIGLTVHKSKGLEYGTVIMPATDDAIDKPHENGLDVSYIDEKIGYCFSSNGKQYSNCFYESKTEIKEMMMEESRILYVAMTRAIDNFIWFVDLDAKGNNWGEMLKAMHEEA